MRRAAAHADVRVLVLALLLLVYPLLLGCDRVDRFAADPPEDVTRAVAEADGSGGDGTDQRRLVAVKGIVDEARDVDEGIRLAMFPEGPTGLPARLDVRFDRPGTVIPTGKEAHVLGYLERDPTGSAGAGLRLHAVGIYVPDTTAGFYLRPHEREFIAWSMGELADESRE